MTATSFGPIEMPMRQLVRWGLYPASWVVLLVGFHRILAWGEDPRTVWIQSTAILAPAYLLIELTLPYQRRWSMTWRSFLADLRFILLNGAVGAAVSAMLALAAISTAGDHRGPASDWPVGLQLLSTLLIFEAINYTLHRAMHRMKGRIGRFLWLSHAAHHLPSRLYLVMHAVFHPLNGILIQALALILPIWAMGQGPEAVAMFFMINGMHGLISHFNVDVRLGWLSYVFSGTETHRYHHSADPAEAGNFGATLMLYDLLFGTFVYRPGVPPQDLGVTADQGLPDYADTLAVLTLPLGRR